MPPSLRVLSSVVPGKVRLLAALSPVSWDLEPPGAIILDFLTYAA
jgi:hypothetical protein